MYRVSFEAFAIGNRCNHNGDEDFAAAIALLTVSCQSIRTA